MLPLQVKREGTMKIFFAPAASVVLLIMYFPALSYGQANVEARADEISQSLVKGHVAWKTKLSSPGVSIQAKESGRQGSLVTYNLYVSGLPSDQMYAALTGPIGQAKPSPLMEGVSIGKGGVVMCAGRTPEQCSGEGKDDPIDFTFNPTKGEPDRVAHRR